MNNSRLPSLLRIALALLSCVLAVVILIYASDVLIPLTFAALLSMLLYPICQFLQKLGLNRFVANFVVVSLAIALLGAIVVFLGIQFTQFTGDFPRVKASAGVYFARLQSIVRQSFGITYEDQLLWLKNAALSALAGEEGIINRTLVTFADLLTLGVLTPLFTFLFLFYKDLMVQFSVNIFPHHRSMMKEILREIRIVVRNYMIGLMLETVIVAVLATGVLFLFGIDYAVLLGISAALLNLLPYIGGILGSVLPVFFALITKDSLWFPAGVFGALTVVQVLDSYVITPLVIARSVRINAFVTLAVALVGGQVWGIAGVLLSRPLVAILKVICDRIESLQWCGALLGGQSQDAARSLGLTSIAGSGDVSNGPRSGRKHRTVHIGGGKGID